MNHGVSMTGLNNLKMMVTASGGYVCKDAKAWCVGQPATRGVRTKVMFMINIGPLLGYFGPFWVVPSWGGARTGNIFPSFNCTDATALPCLTSYHRSPTTTELVRFLHTGVLGHWKIEIES